MYYKSFFRLLFFSFCSLVSSTVTPLLEVKIQDGEDHKIWHEVVSAYSKAKKEFEDDLSQRPNLYKSAKGLELIQSAIDYFASFAEGKALVQVTRNGHASVIQFPALHNAPTKKELARQLFEQATGSCNAEAIAFLARKYDLAPNAATVSGRTLLDALGDQQTDTTPAATLGLLVKLGLDTKHINTWNAKGDTPVHKAAQRLLANYWGFKHSDYNFNKQLAAGNFKLPEHSSKSEELKKWVAVREEAMKNQCDLIVQYKKLGGLDIPNKDGKKPSDILKECANEGPCKEAYEALLKTVVVKTTAGLGTSALLVGSLTKHATLVNASKIIAATAIVAATGYFCKKAYDKIKKYRSRP